MAVTLKNISEICKVDVSTVSRALRNDTRVKAKTREFIQNKAAELGYTPNLAARNLVSGKTLNLWLVISQLTNPIEQEPAQFLSQSLHDKGYELLITLYHCDTEKFNHLLLRLSQHVADGAFIIPSMEYSAPAYLPLLNSNFPLVFIDRHPTFANCTTVTTNNYDITQKLLARAAKAGSKYFIIIMDPANSAASQRLDGAVEFLTQNKLGFTLATEEQIPPAEAMKQPVTIFSSCGLRNDQYAQKFMTLNRPPKLISASFDYAPLNKSFFDKILVAEQNFKAIAETAADLMLKKINGDVKARTIEIKAKIK